MSEDFCVLHGYQFMRAGYPVAYCAECDRLRAAGVDPVQHWMEHEGDYPTLSPPVQSEE